METYPIHEPLEKWNQMEIPEMIVPTIAHTSITMLAMYMVLHMVRGWEQQVLERIACTELA